VSPSSLRSFETRLWKSAEPYNTPEQTANTRKKKKNKYAKFSKADKIELDPFEALIKESEQKLQSIELEKTELEKTKRAPLPPPPEASTKTLEFPNNKDIDPYDPTSFGFVEIGSILGPHGVHGWVKVAGCTDFPERLTRAGIPLHMKPVRKRAPRKVTLAAGKFLGDDQFLIQLQGYYDRTASQTLKGSTLYFATQQDSVEREDDEIVLNELIGLSVYRTTDVDGEEGLVGTILGVVLAEEMCAIPGLLHDQLEVGVTRKSSSEEPDAPPGSLQDLLLIPLVPEIVTKIDLENHMILVDPPAGLLDLTYVREEKVKLKGLLAPAKE
jgi:16S rRNA processing protein RimM